MTEEGNRLGFELSLHVVMFHEAIARRLGVTNSEHKMLDLLTLHPGGVTPGVLAASTGLSNAAVTKIVDRLVAAGYAERRRNPSDGRSFLVHRTSKVDTVSQPSLAGLVRRIEELSQSFDEAEGAAVARWLRGVIEALREETARLESE